MVGAGLHTTQTAGLALATDLAAESARSRGTGNSILVAANTALSQALANGNLLQVDAALAKDTAAKAVSTNAAPANGISAVAAFAATAAIASRSAGTALQGQLCANLFGISRIFCAKVHNGGYAQLKLPTSGAGGIAAFAANSTSAGKSSGSGTSGAAAAYCPAVRENAILKQRILSQIQIAAFAAASLSIPAAAFSSSASNSSRAAFSGYADASASAEGEIKFDQTLSIGFGVLCFAGRYIAQIANQTQNVEYFA